MNFKNTHKRGLALLLSLVMVISSMSLTAFAAEEARDPGAAPYGDPYDEVIETAGEVENTDVPEAVETDNDAIESIDAETAEKISAAEQAVKDNEAVVNAANDTVTEAVNTANSAQQTVEAAQEAVTNASTLTEREAAVEIANAAVNTAAEAVAAAEEALATANSAYDSAAKAVEDAQAALDKLTQEHNSAVGEAKDAFDAAIQAAQEAVNEAQAKLDGAAETRDELKSAAEDAQTKLDEATTAQTTAEELLETAKKAAAGLKVDTVLESEDKQKDLADQTQNVQDTKKALDELDISEADERQKANDAQNVISAVKPDIAELEKELDGKDKTKTETAKNTAEAAVSELTQAVADLNGNYAEAEKNYEAVANKVIELLQWGETKTPIVDGAAATFTYAQIKKDLATFYASGTLPNEKEYRIVSLNDYTAEQLVTLLQQLMDKQEKTAKEYDRLSDIEAIRDLYYQDLLDISKKRSQTQKELGEKQTALNELTETLKKFTALEEKTAALGDAEKALKEAEEALKTLKDAQDAYGAAVAELSKTLTDKGTAYSSKDYDKLMEDAGKLQTAIDRLKELNEAIEAKNAADAAQKEAQYNHEHAQAGLKAAEDALASAQKKVDDAKANESTANLAALEANLEKAKADLETAQKAVEDAERNKDAADGAKAAADQNAADAAQAVEDAIRDIENSGGTGSIIPGGTVPGDDAGDDATTIADQEVPLAGLMPLHMLLEELRQHEEISEIELPEDFKWLDHEYAQAIYWGLQEKLVVDTEEAPLDPDEVITVALLRSVLTNFAEYKGCDFTVTLAGEDDELVMDLGERLDAFYAELDAFLSAKAA